MPARELLERQFLYNPIGTWLVAAAVAVAGFAALYLIRRLLIKRLERTATATDTLIDDVALDGLRRTSKLLLLVVAIVGGSLALQIPPNGRTLLEKVAKLAFVLQAASWGSGAIRFWLLHATRTKGAQDKASLTTINVIGLVLRIILFTLIFLLALQAFGVDVLPLLTGLGIAGVAVALAVQNVLGDLLASLSIALDKPFVIGDFVVVDTFQGTVEHIGLKTTRLRSLSGEQIVVSNAELLKARIRNFQTLAERRVLFQLSIGYDTPAALVEQVPSVVREIVEAQERTRFDRSHFSAFADSALVIETVYFVLASEYNVYMDTQQRINLAIMRRFEELGIAFAFPTRTVVVRGADGLGPAPASAG